MCRRESEHQIAREPRHAEERRGAVGCYSLAKRAEDDQAEHYPQYCSALEEQPDVYQHSHAYQEVGNEYGVANELYAVHQRRYLRDEPVQYQSGEERSEDAFQSDVVGECCAEEQYRHDEDEPHHRVAVLPQEPAHEPGYEQYHYYAERHNLHYEEYPVEPFTRSPCRIDDGCQRYECQEERDHRRPHAER